VGSALWVVITSALPVPRATPDSPVPSQFLLSHEGHKVLPFSVLDEKEVSFDEGNIVQKRGSSAGELPTPKSKSTKSPAHKYKWNLFTFSRHEPHGVSTGEKYLAPLPAPKEGGKSLGNFFYGKEWSPEKERKSNLPTTYQTNTETKPKSSLRTSKSSNISSQELKAKEKGKAVEVVESSSRAQVPGERKKRVQFQTPSKINQVFDLSEEPVAQKKNSAFGKVIQWVKGRTPSKANTASIVEESRTDYPHAKGRGERSSLPNVDHLSTSEASASSSTKVQSDPSHTTTAPPKKKGGNPLSILKKKFGTSSRPEGTDPSKLKEYMEAHRAEISIKSPPYDMKIAKSPEEEMQIEARRKRIDAELRNEAKGKGKKMPPSTTKARQEQRPVVIHKIDEHSSHQRDDTIKVQSNHHSSYDQSEIIEGYELQKP
jgi:hypothetical protein